MLRNVLTRVPGFATWPCDEINYVWRHGNRDQLDDELPIEAATPSVRRYIRRSFSWVRTHCGSPVVVEKTCATSLRVPFVDALLPEARFVFIHRDGADAAASASQRWNADLDLPYLARKARFVPTVDLPHYARRYLRGRVSRRGPLRRRPGALVSPAWTWRSRTDRWTRSAPCSGSDASSSRWTRWRRSTPVGCTPSRTNASSAIRSSRRRRFSISSGIDRAANESHSSMTSARRASATPAGRGPTSRWTGSPVSSRATESRRAHV